MSNDDTSSGWCTIESDPGVFTEMIGTIGAQNLEVVEILTLHDEETLRAFEPIHGFLFLFKWTGKDSADKSTAPEDQNSDSIYFAQQTVHNACATQALINILLNVTDRVDIGETLQEFRAFTEDFDSHLRGDLIGQHDILRSVHNSFSRPHCFDFERDKKSMGTKGDVYHFVGFIYKNGAIWELDGLRTKPVRRADCTNQADWVSAAREVILKRIDAIAAMDSEGTGQGISFNLLALTEDRIKKYERLKTSDATNASHYEELIQEVVHERAQQREENVRRRHNYIPTIVALLRTLAQEGKLASLLEKYKQK